MNIKLFNSIWSDALNASDRDAFTSDWALSTIWEDGPSSIEDRADICGRIWDLAHMTLADIRHELGLTQSQLSERFCLPFRTVTNWETRQSCAPYVRLLIARLGGLTRGLIDEVAP